MIKTKSADSWMDSTYCDTFCSQRYGTFEIQRGPSGNRVAEPVSRAGAETGPIRLDRLSRESSRRVFTCSFCVRVGELAYLECDSINFSDGSG